MATIVGERHCILLRQNTGQFYQTLLG